MSSSIKDAVRHLKKADPILAKIIKGEDRYKAYRKRSAFESLIRIIVGQQLSTIAAATIFNRFKEYLKNNKFTAESVRKIPDTKFYEAGISKAKTRSIKAIADEVRSNNLNFRRLAQLDDDRVLDELIRIKGIGPWTAQIYLMFVMRRPDIFPVTDGGIVNAMKLLYGNHKSENDFIAISENWRPYRTFACWFLWRYLDNSRK